MGLKELLKNNRNIHYLGKCLKKMKNDPEFVDSVINENPYALKCKTYGPKNADKNIYYIKAGRKLNGFFAEFRSIINYLIFADRFGFVPVIEFTSDFEYYEENGVYGITNPYEYYFEQPKLVSIDETLESFNVFQSNINHLYYGESYKKENDGYAVSDDYINKAAEIIKKYIHFKKDTINYFTSSSKNFPDLNSLIGVHVRGGDFKREYKGHPRLISYDRYIEETKKILGRGTCVGIFLATDDADAVKAFQSVFGNQLFYYEDVKRTSSDKSVMFSVDERELHKYKLGLEVLRDVWTLANCGALVAGPSQVSICAQMFNKAFDNEYIDKFIIDAGISENGKVFKNAE